MIRSGRNTLPRGAWGPQGSKQAPGVSWQVGVPGRDTRGAKRHEGCREGDGSGGQTAQSWRLLSVFSCPSLLSALNPPLVSALPSVECRFAPGRGLHAPFGGWVPLPLRGSARTPVPLYAHNATALFLHVYMFRSFSFEPFFLCTMQSFLGIPRRQVSAPKLAVSEGYRHVSLDNAAIGGIFSLRSPLGAHSE